MFLFSFMHLIQDEITCKSGLMDNRFWWALLKQLGSKDYNIFKNGEKFEKNMFYIYLILFTVSTTQCF